MTESEAMRHVCAVAGREMEALFNSGTSEFFEELDSCEILPEMDHEPVYAAVRALIDELDGRGAC